MIIEKLANLANQLEEANLAHLASDVDTVMERMTKVAQYVGTQGYWVRNERCWANCYRQKRANNPKKSAQVIWFECQEEYQDSINKGSSKWDKYAQGESLIKTSGDVKLSRRFGSELQKRATKSGVGDAVFEIIAEQMGGPQDEMIDHAGTVLKIAERTKYVNPELSQEAYAVADEIIKIAQSFRQPWYQRAWNWMKGGWGQNAKDQRVISQMQYALNRALQEAQKMRMVLQTARGNGMNMNTPAGQKMTADYGRFFQSAQNDMNNLYMLARKAKSPVAMQAYQKAFPAFQALTAGGVMNPAQVDPNRLEQFITALQEGTQIAQSGATTPADSGAGQSPAASGGQSPAAGQSPGGSAGGAPAPGGGMTGGGVPMYAPFGGGGGGYFGGGAGTNQNFNFNMHGGNANAGDGASQTINESNEQRSQTNEGGFGVPPSGGKTPTVKAPRTPKSPDVPDVDVATPAAQPPVPATTSTPSAPAASTTPPLDGEEMPPIATAPEVVDGSEVPPTTSLTPQTQQVSVRRQPGQEEADTSGPMMGFDTADLQNVTLPDENPVFEQVQNPTPAPAAQTMYSLAPDQMNPSLQAPVVTQDAQPATKQLFGPQVAEAPAAEAPVTPTPTTEQPVAQETDLFGNPIEPQVATAPAAQPAPLGNAGNPQKWLFNPQTGQPTQDALARKKPVRSTPFKHDATPAQPIAQPAVASVFSKELTKTASNDTGSQKSVSARTVSLFRLV